MLRRRFLIGFVVLAFLGAATARTLLHARASSSPSIQIASDKGPEGWNDGR